jgi:hypothetical protein
MLRVQVGGARDTGSSLNATLITDTHIASRGPYPTDSTCQVCDTPGTPAEASLNIEQMLKTCLSTDTVPLYVRYCLQIFPKALAKISIKIP